MVAEIEFFSEQKGGGQNSEKSIILAGQTYTVKAPEGEFLIIGTQEGFAIRKICENCAERPDVLFANGDTFVFRNRDLLVAKVTATILPNYEEDPMLNPMV